LSTGTTRPARTARFALRRHRNLIVKLRHGGNQQAHFAFSRNDHFAILTAFEHGIKAVQTQISLLLFFAVAPKTRPLQEGTDIFGVGNALLVGGWRKLAEVKFVDVPFVIGFGRPGSDDKAENDECRCSFHILIFSFVGRQSKRRRIKGTLSRRKKSPKLGHDNSQNGCARTLTVAWPGVGFMI